VFCSASEEIYKAGQANGASGGSSQQPGANANGSDKKDEAVTDVDFEEVKDDKKK
jgi:hypothetical protein